MFRTFIVAFFPLIIHGSGDCEQCTFQIDESLSCVNQLLLKIEPVPLTKLNPCDTCYVYGISRFSRSPGYDVCSKKAANSTIQHQFRVTFDNLTMVCGCNFPLNANDLVLAAATTAGSLVPQNCPSKLEADVVNSFIKTGLPPLNLTEWLEAPQCKSLPVPVKVKIGKRASETTMAGNVYAQWLQPEITFKSTTNPGSNRVSISDVTLLRRSDNPIHMWCQGSGQFNSFCQCLIAGNFQTYLLIQAIHMILPCRVDQESQKQHGIVDYFKCDD